MAHLQRAVRMGHPMHVERELLGGVAAALARAAPHAGAAPRGAALHRRCGGCRAEGAQCNRILLLPWLQAGRAMQDRALKAGAQ